jgi:hypothetical protein
MKLVVSVFLFLYFIRFGSGIDIRPSQTTKVLLQAVFYAALVIVFLFIAHFAAGIHFNIKLIGLFVLLAVVGMLVGIVARHFNLLVWMPR